MNLSSSRLGTSQKKIVLLVLLILILSLIAYIFYKTPWQDKPGKATITKVGDQAFGTLMNAGSPAARSQGTALTQAAPTDSASSGEQMIAPDIAFAPNPFHYVYAGEDLPQTADKVEVLRRITGNTPSAEGIIKDLSGIPLKSSALEKASVSRISLTQGSETYQVDIDFTSGTVAMYLQSNSTLSREKLVSDSSQSVPSDTEVTAVTDAFLESFGIDRTGYGNPQVQKTNTSSLAADTTFTPTMIQAYSSISVIYPLQINGKPVYDSGGTPVGMSLIVDMLNKKVSSLSGLRTLFFESSLYEGEKDFNLIKKMAENWGGITQRTGEEIKLSTPSEAYMLLSRYQEGKSEELLVPAYVFPVAEESAAKSPLSRLVVPIAKELMQAPDSGKVVPLSAPAGTPQADTIVSPATPAIR